MDQNTKQLFKKPLKAGNSPSLRKPLAKEFQKAQLTQKVVVTQPAAVRIFHWGFTFSLTALILTGLELHKPLSFLAFQYGKVFIAHSVFGWLAISFFTLRLVDMLIRKDTSLIPTLKDLKSFPRLLAYYLFLRSTPPPSGKYNSGQKLIFSSWILLFAFIAFISMASYWAGEHLDWVPKLLGGFQVLRWIKFISLIYFSATIPLHIYLSLTEDVSRLQSMLSGYEQKSPN
jgi:Ni/Fe-hydrogenase 1 B-type cytochrome subunit